MKPKWHWTNQSNAEEIKKKLIKTLRSDNWKGKKRDSETLRKLQEGKMRWIEENPEKWLAKYEKMRQAYKGENNPHWKGGKRTWLHKQVKVRDDYICQICGLREPEIMETDHIMPRSKAPELEFVIDNLVTLCPNCHRRKTIREYKEGIYNKK